MKYISSTTASASNSQNRLKPRSSPLRTLFQRGNQASSMAGSISSTASRKSKRTPMPRVSSTSAQGWLSPPVTEEKPNRKTIRSATSSPNRMATPPTK